MNSLRLFDNFNDHFIDFESEIENFFKPIFPRSIFRDDSSDEESEEKPKRTRRIRKHIIKKNPELKSTSFTKSFYSKTSTDNEGKPMTYTYENQVEDHIQNGHQYRKRKEEINKNGNKKSILEKQMDNKVHRIISSTNNKGETKHKNVFKGIKQNELDNFNKNFDEEFNKAFNWKQLPQENTDSKKQNKSNYSLRSNKTNINQIGDSSDSCL